MKSDSGPKGPLSARIEPFWLNPATIKGTVAIGAGLFVLAAPNLSAVLLRIVIGVVLVATGLSDLWFGARNRARVGGTRVILEAVVMVVFGLLLLAVPNATIRAVATLGSIYLVARGVSVLLSVLRARRAGEPWTVDLVRGMLYASFAVVLFLMADQVVEALIAVAAAGAVILGAIMLVYGVRKQSDAEQVDLDVASVSQLMNRWLREQDVGAERRSRIGDGLFFEEPGRNAKLTSWWVMLMLSVAIATFGVVQDSTAVVIGAMLIAPLMIPILGTSAGIVNAWHGRVIASAVLVLAGAAAAIGLAFIIGQWVPIIVPLAQNSQVISRVSPNVIDMMIALAAGAAGAYANVDDRVADSIAGVAIAVALVPPLGVVGLTLQAGMFEDALGALLLFLTNLVSIILAAALVFFLTGYAPYKRLQESRAEITAFLRMVALAAIVILIPLSLTAEDVISGTARQGTANQAVGQWLEGTTLQVIRVTVNGDSVGVFVTGPDDLPSLAALEDDLAAGFGGPVELRVEHAPTIVVTSGSDD